MTYWPFWLSGMALAGGVVAHWFLTRRMMAVSGRFTKLVDRAREGPREAADMSADELAAAIREMTIAEFGAEAVAAPSDTPPSGAAAVPPAAAPTQSTGDHAVFLVALAVGGLLARLVAGGPEPTLGIEGAALAAITGGSWPVLGALLLGGGILVGFGTRMAGGCTSGHGLTGLSRFQKGSLAATLSFFGAGIVTAFALGMLR